SRQSRCHTSARLWAWILGMVLTTFVLLVIGWSIYGRWYGILIDERNKASLSRLQFVLWAIVIVPSIAVAGVANVVMSNYSGLDFAIPQTVLAVLGISIGVTAIEPLIIG